jgi:death-on-curing protein
VTAPLWLSKELIFALHERLVAEFGGLPGLRDEGLLESALGKPENLHAYGKPSAFELAASYAFGIVKNHPFLDGNKRTGFAAAAVFLETNGYRLIGSEVEATGAVLALAAGDISEAAFAAWLSENSDKASGAEVSKPKAKKSENQREARRKPRKK